MFATPAPRAGPTYRELVARAGAARLAAARALRGPRPVRARAGSADARGRGIDPPAVRARVGCRRPGRRRRPAGRAAERRDEPADDGGLAGRLGRHGPPGALDAGRTGDRRPAGRPGGPGAEPLDQRRRARPRARWPGWGSDTSSGRSTSGSSMATESALVRAGRLPARPDAPHGHRLRRPDGLHVARPSGSATKRPRRSRPPAWRRWPTSARGSTAGAW